MGAAMATLREMIEQLPPELEQEVKDFVEFLIHKHGQSHRNRLRMDWAGSLQEYRGQYTSLELQRAAMQWWGG